MPTRGVRIALWAITAVVLLSGTGLTYLRKESTAITIDDALTDFRDSARESDSPSGADVAGDATPASPTVAPASPAAGDAATTPSPGGASPAGAAAGAGGVGGGPARPAAAASPPPTATTRPTAAEGVYTFATSGYEATDAVGGDRHAYPSQTPATLRRNGCGAYTFRWQPLAERWDESDLCTDGENVAVRRFTTHHEFFRQSQTQEFTCPPTSHVHRPAAPPGSSWTWSCQSGPNAIATKTTYVGETHLTVAGTPVRVAHLLYESTMTGANRGTQRQERWLDPATGLNVQIKTDIDTVADSPFGAVRYEEHYTITLTSLTPRR